MRQRAVGHEVGRLVDDEVPDPGDQLDAHVVGVRLGDVVLAQDLVVGPEQQQRGRAQAPVAPADRARQVEQIKRHKLLDTEWEPGGDELTPTMKLKRKPIAEKYAEEIDALYER